MDQKEKAGIIYDRIAEHWGMPDWNTLPAIDELVNTIISQNTNDRNRDIAFTPFISKSAVILTGWSQAALRQEELYIGIADAVADTVVFKSDFCQI